MPETTEIKSCKSCGSPPGSFYGCNNCDRFTPPRAAQGGGLGALREERIHAQGGCHVPDPEAGQTLLSPRQLHIARESYGGFLRTLNLAEKLWGSGNCVSVQIGGVVVLDSELGGFGSEVRMILFDALIAKLEYWRGLAKQRVRIGEAEATRANYLIRMHAESKDEDEDSCEGCGHCVESEYCDSMIAVGRIVCSECCTCDNCNGGS